MNILCFIFMYFIYILYLFIFILSGSLSWLQSHCCLGKVFSGHLIHKYSSKEVVSFWLFHMCKSDFLVLWGFFVFFFVFFFFDFLVLYLPRFPEFSPFLSDLSLLLAVVNYSLLGGLIFLVNSTLLSWNWVNMETVSYVFLFPLFSSFREIL